MSYSKLKSLVANVEAIATAMKVRIDDRQATDEEKEVLSRYSGFGGIKDVLNIGTGIEKGESVVQRGMLPTDRKSGEDGIRQGNPVHNQKKNLPL
jgi:hypothetical protein